MNFGIPKGCVRAEDFRLGAARLMSGSNAALQREQEAVSQWLANSTVLSGGRASGKEDLIIDDAMIITADSVYCKKSFF